MQTKSTKNSNEANAMNNAPKQAAEPAPKKEEKPQETLVQIKQETAAERAARMQQELQQTLQKLNALQELNKKRTKFIETLDLLKDAKEKMQGEEEFERLPIFRIGFNYVVVVNVFEDNGKFAVCRINI